MYVGHAMLVREGAGYISDMPNESREDPPVTLAVIEFQAG